MNVIAKKTQLSGNISVPGSKSHTIRAGIFSLLASGPSIIRNPLESADCFSCMEAIQAFGATVTIEPGIWRVTPPKGGLQVPARVVDVGDSGSVLYFIASIAATLPGWSVLTGNASICTRPISALLNALVELGAEGFTTRPGIEAPPAVIRGPITAGTIELEGNLSQHVSGIMMAAPRITGTTVVTLRDPKETPFLQMTCDWLETLGVPVSYDRKKLNRFEIKGPCEYQPFDQKIPSDWEAVAFPLVAAIITGSRLTITGIDCSGGQGDAAIVDILQEMGADIVLNESTKELHVNSLHKENDPISLIGGTFNCAGYPDAVPALAVAACFAQGKTRLVDIAVCRLKETDRISLMRQELTRLGATAIEGPDWLEIQGKGGIGLHSAVVDSHNDHRIAMALAVAGLAIPGDGVVVQNAECSDVSFPHFYEIMNTIDAGFICMND